jgi:predicted transcriptional regulator
MLHNIQNNGFVGPKTGNYPVGDRVRFALEKGLIVRSATGNFILTEKGLDLLEEKVRWESL